VLFTILLAVLTSGEGLALGSGHFMRRLPKFRNVGKLTLEFAEQAKTSQKSSKPNAARKHATPSISDLPKDDITFNKRDVQHESSISKANRKKRPTESVSRTAIPKRNRPAADNWKTYKTHGIESQPMQTPEGRAVVNSYLSQGMDLETAVGYTETLLRSGRTLPEKILIKKGQKLYKVVPEGTMPGEHSAFFATKQDIDLLEGISYDDISDQLGIPLEIQQTIKFEIVEIEALHDTEVFQSVIAPTTQCEYPKPRGAIQTLVTNRKAFYEPKTTGIKRP
jgi:hypothetical protein